MMEQLLPAIVSVSLGVVAWLQWRTAADQRNISKEQKAISDSQRRIAEQKLKLDLFDRRFKIYSAIREFACSLLLNGEITNAMRAKYVSDTSETEFFFEAEITRFQDDLQRLAKESASIRHLSSTYPPESDMHEGFAQRLSRIREAAKEKHDGMTALFHPYLGFNLLKIS